MATPLLPPEFKEFLKLFNKNKVEYLLIGGYAVGYYGLCERLRIWMWIASNSDNASKVLIALHEFGFKLPESTKELFLKPDNVARMGVPPFRIEMLTSISGVRFEECYAERVVDAVDDVEVPIISLRHLKINKKASGRLKDLTDLEHLP